MKVLNIKFHANPSCGIRAGTCRQRDGRTDGRDELIGVFRDYEKLPKNGFVQAYSAFVCVSLCGPHFGFRTSCWVSVAGHLTCHVTFYIDIQWRLMYEPDCCSMAFLLIIVLRPCCWLL